MGWGNYPLIDGGRATPANSRAGLRRNTRNSRAGRKPSQKFWPREKLPPGHMFPSWWRRFSRSCVRGRAKRLLIARSGTVVTPRQCSRSFNRADSYSVSMWIRLNCRGQKPGWHRLAQGHAGSENPISQDSRRRWPQREFWERTVSWPTSESRPCSSTPRSADFRRRTPAPSTCG